MATYDLRCSSCNKETEQKCAYADAELKRCDECGGQLKIFITQVHVSNDAMPTRNWDNIPNAPKIVRSDGSAINPGHEPVTTADIRLTPDQTKRLGL